MIEYLEARIKSERERNKTLVDKCAEHLKDIKMFKTELTSVVDAMQQKDHQLETLEKKKVHCLLMQQQKAIELEHTDQTKKEVEEKLKAFEESLGSFDRGEKERNSEN